MGKIKQGILGGFSGKVGTVVGSFWKGRSTMRALAPNVHNPKTAAQQAVRARFKLLSENIAPLTSFINQTYAPMAKGMAITQDNCALKVNFAQAITGSGTNVDIDWSRFSLSSSTGLLNIESPAVTVAQTGHKLNLTWTNNAGADSDVLDGDHVLFCVYNKAKKTATFDMVSASREDEAAVISYPSAWAGDQLEVYCVARSMDKTRISSTAYLGAVVAA